MKKMKPLMKIWLSLCVIVIVLGGAFCYTFYQLNKIDTVKISKTDDDLGIKYKVIPSKQGDSELVNIALFGVDRRDKDEPSRSDSIMIFTIDKKNNKIKMSSIMRDTYVKIKGHGETKINHAYFYGGPQLAIRTINENFNLDIRDYVTVDFFNLEKLIDAIGGVTVDVKEDEISLIPQITKSGPQNLRGLQAVAYSRIRYTDGGDFRRTERQRVVLSAMLTNIHTLGIAEFPSVVSKLLPFTETSMNSMDIIKTGIKVFTSNKMTLERERFPVDGYYSGKMIDGVWYLVVDMKVTIEQLHKYIYEDIKPGTKH